uniref:C-type lectin domain-containing protein n=1 Tax=Acrobeloides nanus TaxID=290746 RepID=A0A914D146_9BILA
MYRFVLAIVLLNYLGCASIIGRKGSCPSGGQTGPDGRCYVLYSSTNNCHSNWNTSNVFCQQQGGQLASISNSFINAFLWKMVKSANINTQRGECDYFPGHGTFIGLYPKISGNTCQWSWSDGSPMSYSNWDSSYNNSCDPNDWFTKNSVVYLTTTDGKWNLDDNAEIGYPSICAFD